MHFVNAVKDFQCQYRIHVLVVQLTSHLIWLSRPRWSGKYGVFFRRQLQNYYAVYWIFKALSRHKSYGCKIRYGEYCLFYTVQACKFVLARFCYRVNWARVDTRITVINKVFYSAFKTNFWWCKHSLSLFLILSCLFLCSSGAPNMANH